MHVVVANIKSNPKMPQAFVEGDIRFMASLGRIFFGSEITPPRYKAAWIALLTTLGLARTFNINVECPISIPTKYWRPDAVPEPAYVVRTHGGKRTVSPTRYLSVLKAIARSKHVVGIRVAFVATHYVSGGWHKGFIPFRKWRIARWWLHFARHQEEVAALVAQGYNVVTGGDFNRTTPPILHPRSVLIAQHGLDHLYAIPAQGYRVVIDEPAEFIHTTSVHTDHPMLVGHFHFAKAA